MAFIDALTNSKMIGDDICIVDSATTHLILHNAPYFAHLIMGKG